MGHESHQPAEYVPRQPYDGWSAETDLDVLDLMVSPGRGETSVPTEASELLRMLGVEPAASAELDQLLDGYFSACSATEATRRLAAVPRTLVARNTVPLVYGIDGLVALQHLYGSRRSATRCVAGRIRDFIYDRATSLGHLAVDVVTEFQSGRREFYHWDVEARLVVHRRQDHRPDDPFPDVDLVLPRALLDPASDRNIWRRGLNLKLHARGCDVRVQKIYRRIDDGPLERLPFQNPLYASTPATCVDLLAASLDDAGEVPPTTYQELRRFLPGQQRPLYCLGRCGHPTIVNSGH